MLEISRDKSILLKGIVITMMVFLHLFGKDNSESYASMFYVGDETFVKWLSNACGPVAFFVFLSGYGLASTYNMGNLGFVKQLRRIVKLYIHYWIVLAFFLFIGWCLYPDRYPGNLDRVLINMTGWKTNYNYEMWFLFPYSLVALTSKYIMQAIERIGYLKAVVISAVLYFCACYVISRYFSTNVIDNQFLSWCVVYIQFLYPFTIGTAFFHFRLHWKWKLPIWIILLIMVVSIAVVATINVSVTYIIYVPLMVFLLNQLSYPDWLKLVLMELGRKSMLIWMIHTWLCYYLFNEQVYALKYPALMLAATLFVSYLMAIPFMWFTKKCLASIKL